MHGEPLRIDDSNRPRRSPVAYVLFGLSHGGTESLCLDLVRSAPPGLPQVVISIDPDRRALEAEFRAIPGLELRFGPGIDAPRRELHRWLASSFRELRPRAVLTLTFSIMHLLVGSAARVAGVPLVFSHVGSCVDRAGPRWKSRLLLAASHLLRVPLAPCSSTVSRSITQLGLGMPAGSRVIQNGVDVAGIAAAAERSARARQDHSPRVIGMVARMDASKAHPSLLRAFRILALDSELGDTELWLVGDGTARSELEALAEALGISARVRFLGSRSDVAELLGRMDVFVLATKQLEGFGLALVEAMAAGLPVVATDVPACREVLDDGAAGLLVLPDDAEALADACRELLRSTERRAVWSERARRRAVEHYDRARSIRAWFDALGVNQENT